MKGTFHSDPKVRKIGSTHKIWNRRMIAMMNMKNVIVRVRRDEVVE